MDCYNAMPLQIDEAWAGTKVGEWISQLLGVWQRLGTFFIKVFDRHPEVGAPKAQASCHWTESCWSTCCTDIQQHLAPSGMLLWCACAFVRVAASCASTAKPLSACVPLSAGHLRLGAAHLELRLRHRHPQPHGGAHPRRQGAVRGLLPGRGGAAAGCAAACRCGVCADVMRRSALHLQWLHGLGGVDRAAWQLLFTSDLLSATVRCGCMY